MSKQSLRFMLISRWGTLDSMTSRIASPDGYVASGKEIGVLEGRSRVGSRTRYFSEFHQQMGGMDGIGRKWPFVSGCPHALFLHLRTRIRGVALVLRYCVVRAFFRKKPYFFKGFIFLGAAILLAMVAFTFYMIDAWSNVSH